MRLSLLPLVLMLMLLPAAAAAALDDQTAINQGFDISFGGEDAFSQGKRGLLYAIIGLIVIILALAIVNFFTSNIV